jgi:hypothetical protein
MERRLTMKKATVLALMIIMGLALGALSCQTLSKKTGPTATLEVIPAETFLSPALIKKPISFKGSGFQPEEMISIEMILPPGLEMKGLKEGENVVGIAVATAGDKGNFTAAMAPTATLNWFFQVGWTPLLTPDLKKAKPIPPGVYRIKATGLASYRIATATLRIVPPPKKK